MIIGSDDDAHAQHMRSYLREQSQDVEYLDTRCYPAQLSINLTPADVEHPGELVTPYGRTIDLMQVTSVYWRYHHGLIVPPGVPQSISGIVYREIESAVGSLFRNTPHVNWVNPVSAIERHRYKPHQLAMLAQAGMRIPDTLITNQPEAVKAFFDKYPNGVIYKPVAGGAHTAKLTKDDLTETRLSDLRTSPVQFQELIEGVDVRVYVIGQKLYSAEIQSQTLDFRDDPQAPIVPIDLPDEIKAQCYELAHLFEYQLTGIDLRRTPAGEYVFIEGNPSPMFIYFERVSGFPITYDLARLLMQKTEVS